MSEGKSEALLLAESFVAGAAVSPVELTPGHFDGYVLTLTLARAVVAQDAELQKLKAGLAEAPIGWRFSTAPEHDDVYARIAELRELVGP